METVYRTLEIVVYGRPSLSSLSSMSTKGSGSAEHTGGMEGQEGPVGGEVLDVTPAEATVSLAPFNLELQQDGCIGESEWCHGLEVWVVWEMV